MRKYDIYGIGAALVDTEIEVSDEDLSHLSIQKGVMTLVDETRQTELIKLLGERLVASRRASGGSGANSVIAASLFGAQAFYSCKVANDENGAFYLEDLENTEVQFHVNNGSTNGHTGKCLVMITPDAERTMNTFLGVSATLSVDDIDTEALSQSNYAYIEGYLVTSDTGRPAAIRLRELAKEYGVKTALSLSDPAIVEYFHQGLTDMIGDGVDILFCNEHEALQFSKQESLEQAVEVLKKHANIIAITLGGDGAVIHNQSETYHIKPHKVKAIDTNGAGDMFAGAFLYAISKGKTLQEAGDLASKAASVVVSQYGPRLKPEQHKEILASTYS